MALCTIGPRVVAMNVQVANRILNQRLKNRAAPTYAYTHSRTLTLQGCNLRQSRYAFEYFIVNLIRPLSIQ